MSNVGNEVEVATENPVDEEYEEDKDEDEDEEEEEEEDEDDDDEWLVQQEKIAVQRVKRDKS